MICTVEEAKKKWCPMVRHQDTANDPASNRASVFNPCEVERWNRCIADKCFPGWRWWDSDKKSGYCGFGGPPSKEDKRLAL